MREKLTLSFPYKQYTPMKTPQLSSLTLTLALTLALALPTLAQSPAEKAVMKPVEDLFKGMKLGDSALVHSAFTKKVGFSTVARNKEGKPVLIDDSLTDFLKAVGSPHTEQWNELLWDTEIRIDGDFAQVYTKYGFFLGKKFLHCGIDAFHLFRGEDGKWRIFNLADTRQTTGCNVPEKVSSQL